MLSDLYNISETKFMAYETCLSLEKEYSKDLDELRAEFEAQGHSVLILSDAECNFYGGAFFVYDEEALAAHLTKHQDVLTAYEWPSEPRAFIIQVASSWAPEKTDLFDLVSDAFGDKDHPGRTDTPVPDHDERYQPQYLDMLRAIEAQRNASHASASGQTIKPKL